jgi:hypothetical protein
LAIRRCKGSFYRRFSIYHDEMVNFSGFQYCAATQHL